MIYFLVYYGSLTFNRIYKLDMVVILLSTEMVLFANTSVLHDCQAGLNFKVEFNSARGQGFKYNQKSNVDFKR